MSKSVKRLLSIMMAVVLLFGMMPVTAFATDVDTAEVTPIETHAENPAPAEDPAPVEDPAPAEDPAPVEEPSLVETYLEQINALKVKAENEAVYVEDYAEIFNSLMEINSQVVAAKEAGTITAEEYDEIYNAIGGVVMTLYSYGYDPYAISLAAVDPNMGDYNAKNYVAYDVAKPNPGWGESKGYNDTNHTYVASVTLGGVAVNQANSNGSNYGSTRADNQGTRVGSTLSNFYPGLDTNSGNTKATLLITPATGYYVTQVTIACCDGGAPYNCGTWAQGKEFTQTFNVSNGGSVSLQLPSSAFGHGTNSSMDESPRGLEQYFILIKVAPVPQPLYVAYESGSMTGGVFNDPSQWVSASGSNNYGTGSNETPYTQFKYAYTDPSQVSNWKHFTGTVTQEAKLAAAAQGYYFTGWKATYYVNCDSRYNFSQVYSDPADLIAENVDLRLLTHVKLVAQWAPVKLNVQKVVTGLSAKQNYTINVLKDDAAYQTATFNGAGTKTYSNVVPGTYEVTEEGANQRVTISGKEYVLTTTYSNPVTFTAEGIVSGALREATLTVTNAYEEVIKTEVTATKVWDDADNQDGIRPDSVTINLLANGNEIDSKTVTAADGWTCTFENLDQFANGVQINYTVTEDEVIGYTASVDGYTITNKHTPEKISVSGAKTWEDNNNQDGKRPASITINLLANDTKVDSKVVTANDGWAWTFENLDKYANGQEIVYTVSEEAVAEYTTTTNGMNVTNTHEIEKISVSGAKTWEDNNNQDGKRPASITINLLANGTKVDSKVVTANDGWAYSFTDLPKFEAGQEINYTITEEAVEGYETVINGFNVTNTHKIETAVISGTKTWVDDNDRDGIRPESITINLLADGEVLDTIEVTEAEGWAWTFTDLYKFRDGGVEIVYTITEETVDGYETVVEDFNVTNIHEIETIEVAGAKTWDDADNQDGKRPESITIRLLADGEELEVIEVTEADGWAWSFTELPKFRDQGAEIIYAITEDAVEGYTTTYDGYNVTNSYTPEEISVTVTKTWADSNDADGIRPGFVTIKLLANGEDTGMTLKLDAEGKWTGSFTGLAKYADGELIAYTVDEVAVEGYTTVIKGNMEEGFVVINNHVYIPQTGDNRNPMMWMSVMLVSGLMMALVAFDTKKKRAAK